MSEQIRLQKYLADCGIASRRAAEVMIAEGRIKVNGCVAQLGAKITPGVDEVCFDDDVVAPKPETDGHVYIALHKPPGVITSAHDQFGRTTVLDLVGDVKARLFPVGRLDYATSGLILLTNDGEMANKLTHPRHSVAKIYEAVLRRPLGGADVQAFRKGVVIDGRMTRPAGLIVGPDKRTAKIELKEGRNRQIRKMFEVLDNEVISLKRIGIGQIALGDLEPGKFRHLARAEVKYLIEL